MEALYIFLIVLAFGVGYVLGQNRKKAKEKEPMTPAPKVRKIEPFKYMGETYPNRKSVKTALENVIEIRAYWSPTDLRVGARVYDNYPEYPTKGNGNYIGLRDQEGIDYAVKLDNDGNVLECVLKG